MLKALINIISSNPHKTLPPGDSIIINLSPHFFLNKEENEA